MFPPIPENTIRAARASYGKGNAYLRLGDQLNQLISKLDSELLEIQMDGYMGTLIAALTIIQYAESLTDTELTASLHDRIDLRYALHLPSPTPGLDPLILCAFRQKVLKEHKYCLLLERMLHLLYPALGAHHPINDLNTFRVVKSICANTMRAAAMESISHAIEALSANHFTWLCQVAAPHWYERYSYSLSMLDSSLSIKQKEYTTDSIRLDIQYLLEAVDRSNSQKINALPEIKLLRERFHQLSHYRPEDQCSYCINSPLERRSTFYSKNQNSSQTQ